MVRYNGFRSPATIRVVSSGGNPFNCGSIPPDYYKKRKESSTRQNLLPRSRGVKYTKRGRSVLGGEERSVPLYIRGKWLCFHRASNLFSRTMLVRYNGFRSPATIRVVSSGGNPFSKEPIIERYVVQSLQTTIKREKSPRLDRTSCLGVGV